MDVSLSPELEQFVSTKVESGRYQSASEVVREALHLLEEHDHARDLEKAAFHRELDLRLHSLDRGERVEPTDVRDRLNAKSQARRDAAA